MIEENTDIDEYGHALLEDKLAEWKLLDTLPYPVFLLSDDLHFDWVNHSAESFFQSSRAMLKKTALASIFAEDSTIFTLIGRAITSHNSVSDRSVSLFSPKMGLRRGDIHIVPLMDKNAQISSGISGVLVSIYERTDVQRFEDMEQLKGAALSMSKMTSLLSHEIKNPLAGIKGAAQLLQMDLTEEGHELSEMIVTEADRITSLLNRIDTFSVDAPLALEAVNIHEILDHSIRITTASFGRHLSVIQEYDPSLPLINADKELLVQCFLNLFKNASEATHSGDSLKIRTSYNLSHYMTSISQQRRVYLPLQIEIEDSGEGIPEEVSTRLFEPFVSSKSNGSGLGLSMVASIIADHGGVISLKPVHQGSCFVINLPLPVERGGGIKNQLAADS